MTESSSNKKNQGAALFASEVRLFSQVLDIPEEAISKSDYSAFFSELIEYLPITVFCHDMTQDGKCIFVSKSFEDIWGLPRSAIMQNQNAWSDLVVAEDQQFVRQRFQESTEENRFYELEYRIRDTSGQLRYIHTRFVSLKNPSGNGLHKIGFASDVTQRRAAELRAYETSQSDPLTGLPNRAAFSEKLAAMLSNNNRLPSSNHTYVVFIDLDRFSRINDSLGHSVGDEYLRKVAKRIEQFVGASGFVARIGGDEFAMILTDCMERSSTRQRLIGLQQALNRPISVDGEEVVTSASCGVASYPADGDDPGSLMRAAELAMVNGKSQCRGSLTFFHSDLTRKDTRDRLRRDMALRDAQKNNQFELFYQPQVCGQTQQLRGGEVLLRWRHPVFGLVSPAEFIPQLEDSGDIVEVGYWIIDQACAQLTHWYRQGLAKDFTLAVNVSAAQLLSWGFAERVVDIVHYYGINPGALELELTESAILSDPDRAALVFEELRQAGLRIAIDDFGTGYSSMSYLRRFHLDTLKVDSSFTRGCDTDDTALGIIKSILQLAQTLGMAVVAEGIETRGQAESLSRAGCDLLQGYLFSKPVTNTEFSRLLEASSHETAPGASSFGTHGRVSDE